jgi:hypothetical protein
MAGVVMGAVLGALVLLVLLLLVWRRRQKRSALVQNHMAMTSRPLFHCLGYDGPGHAPTSGSMQIKCIVKEAKDVVG